MTDFTGFTGNVITDADFKVTGDGILDDIMETMTKHVQAQFDRGSITGVEYSSVYLGGMQAALSTATQLFLGGETAVAKADLIKSQKLTEDEKVSLVNAQTLGFRTDAKQKVLAKMMETWAIYYSVAKAGAPPNSANTTEIDELKDDIISDLGGITVANDPIIT